MHTTTSSETDSSILISSGCDTSGAADFGVSISGFSPGAFSCGRFRRLVLRRRGGNFGDISVQGVSSLFVEAALRDFAFKRT